MERLCEVHLYQGNLCNRACPFCTVEGSPTGWFAEHSDEALTLAVRLVDPEGVIKIYGGEPTVRMAETTRIMRKLREPGFGGQLCLFSNGDRARELIELLETAPPACAMINYSIYMGRDAPRLSDESRALLDEYERTHAGSIVVGHEQYYACGRAAALDLGTRAECPRCMPAIFPDGRVHACPFAVERDHPALWLGDADTDPDEIIRRVRQFVEWIDGPHAQLALKLGVDACSICEKRIAELPPPPYAPR